MSTTISPTKAEARSGEYAPDQMSAYFLDLEGLLNRVDSATTYYEVLALDRSAGQDQIKSSFEQVLNLLYPPYVIGKTVPAEVNSRIERAFSKASQAFSVLASFARRRDYDKALLSVGNRVIVPDQPKSRAQQPADSSPESAVRSELSINRFPQQGEVYMESSLPSSNDNRRRCERFRLSIPVRVTGYDQTDGKWHEMTETLDVSRTGLRLRLRNHVKHGMVLYMTLPLPTRLRSHGFAEQSYNVYALVRTAEPLGHRVRLVGLEFLGEHPPAGFLEKPWAIFRTKRWGSKERRRSRREQRAEIVTIEYFDEGMRSISKEEARMENVGRYGLRVRGTKAPAEFESIVVRCTRLRFEGRAALRNRYIGKDGLERLCLQLTGRVWPL